MWGVAIGYWQFSHRANNRYWLIVSIPKIISWSIFSFRIKILGIYGALFFKKRNITISFISVQPFGKLKRSEIIGRTLKLKHFNDLSELRDL